MIYRRFTEKAAEEWRQIYKALQLLEYLIKNGSERVIDDARSHLTLLKMLRQFHFIDQNGKDQGINVRNRAKELTELLSDVDRIRSERKKARANKTKYTGVEGGASFGGGFSSGSRYGGFGGESSGGASAQYGGYSGGVYGDGGGFGGNTNDFRDHGRKGGDQFEEYDEFDEGDKPESSRPRKTSERAGTKKTTPTITGPVKKKEKEKEPEVDLFSFDEPTASSSSAAPAASADMSGFASLNAAPPASGAADEDEFDDFQSATPAAPAPTSQSAFGNPLMTSNASGAAFAAPAPVSAPQQTNLNTMVGLSSVSPPPASTSTPSVNYSAFSTPLASATMSPAANKPASTGYQPSGPNYFTSVQAPQSASTPVSAGGMGALKPVSTGSSAVKKPAGGDAFGALWANASASSGIKKVTPGTGPAMGQLAKEKSSAGIWGAPAAPAKPAGAGQPSGNGSALDDLLG